jgi:hypothetical protein
LRVTPAETSFGVMVSLLPVPVNVAMTGASPRQPKRNFSVNLCIHDPRAPNSDAWRAAERGTQTNCDVAL